jgi:hypothetical protein
MAPESPGNLVVLDLQWRKSRLECDVDRFEPASNQAREFLYVSWNALACPENYIPVGGGVAFAWVPPGFSRRQYRARIDKAGQGFEWIDRPLGLGLMLVLTLPSEWAYLFPSADELGPRPFRFKSTEDGRLALYYWLSSEDGRAVVSWRMEHVVGLDAEEAAASLNDEARLAPGPTAYPAHVDSPDGPGNRPSDEPRSNPDPPEWHRDRAIVVVGELRMGDTYNINAKNVGGVGPGDHRLTINQGQKASAQQIDVRELAKELARLHAQMQADMKGGPDLPERQAAVGAVEAAEEAAKEGDRTTALQRLTGAGQWALDVATKVGVGIATEALKISMGMK